MKPESMCSAWEMHVMVNKGDHISLTRMLQAVNKNVIGTITNKKFKNETLLSTAIKCGHNNIVKLLLKHGADPNQRSFENGRNEPPLITATRFKNLELVKLLLENDANISKTGFYGQDAMFQAVVDNAFDILEFLLKNIHSIQFSHEGKSCPYQVAMEYAPQFSCKRKCLLMLFQYGYSCNCLDRNKMYFTMQNHIPAATNLDICYEVLKFSKNQEKNLMIGQQLSLFNLSKHAIRFHLLQLKSKDNLLMQISKLNLPKKLKEALLLKDCTRNTIFTRCKSGSICIYILL